MAASTTKTRCHCTCPTLITPSTQVFIPATVKSTGKAAFPFWGKSTPNGQRPVFAITANEGANRYTGLVYAWCNRVQQPGAHHDQVSRFRVNCVYGWFDAAMGQTFGFAYMTPLLVCCLAQPHLQIATLLRHLQVDIHAKLLGDALGFRCIGFLIQLVIVGMKFSTALFHQNIFGC